MSDVYVNAAEILKGVRSVYGNGGETYQIMREIIEKCPDIKGLSNELESFKRKMQPTAASGYKYENGNIVFFTDILNGYREEYDTTDKIVSQLNLLLHERYRLMECESHLRLKQTPLMCNPSVINHGMGVSGEYDIDHHLLCPSCNSVVGDCDIMELNGNYCNECGQRITLPDDVYLRQIDFDKYKNCSAESEGDAECQN